MKWKISYRWIFNMFLLRISESVNFCSRVSSREVFWRVFLFWKKKGCSWNIYFIFARIVSNALTAQTIFMIFLCCWKLPLHYFVFAIICIYQNYFKELVLPYFCFNPVDFRQLYICIIAFRLSKTASQLFFANWNLLLTSFYFLTISAKSVQRGYFSYAFVNNCEKCSIKFLSTPTVCLHKENGTKEMMRIGFKLGGLCGHL